MKILKFRPSEMPFADVVQCKVAGIVLLSKLRKEQETFLLTFSCKLF